MDKCINPRIYLAGPEVFLTEDLRNFVLKSKLGILEKLGMIGVDPMDNNLKLPSDIPPSEVALRIYRSNIDMIKSCDGSLVNLTPFRGLSADAGTVFEVGYLSAIGKPMIGYTLNRGEYKDRFTGEWAGQYDDLDRNEHIIEDFGQMDNLMLESAFITSGGQVVRGEEEFSPACLYDAACFERAANSLVGQLRSRGWQP